MLDEDLISDPFLIASEGTSRQCPVECTCQLLWIVKFNQFCDWWSKEFGQPPDAGCNHASCCPHCFESYQPEGFVTRWHGDDASQLEKIGKALAVQPTGEADFNVGR